MPLLLTRRFVCRLAALAASGVLSFIASASTQAQTPPKPAASAASAAVTKWDLPSGYAETVFHTRNLQAFADDVRKSSNGRLDITVYPNNTLVKMADIPSRVRAGTVPMGEIIMTTMAKDAPITAADSVPFIVHSYEDAQRFWRHQRPVLDKALAQQSLIALYAVPWPPQGLYTVKPVREPRDLRGMKMRTYNPTTVRIAELFEAKPVDVLTADVPKALAEGRVDAMMTSATTGVDTKAWTHMKNYLDVRAWFPKNMVIINKNAFDALDEPTRQILRDAAKRAEERGWAMSRELAASATKELAAQGMQVGAPSFQLRTQLRRHGEQFSVEWIRSTGGDAGLLLIPYFGSK